MKIEFTDLKEEDFELVKEIYNYYVINTTVTFHTDKLTAEELKKEILTGHPKYKSFLIKCDGIACGYCYLSQHNKRKAYDRTAELSLYLKPEYSRKGIGKISIDKIEEIARANGIKNLIGIIAEENIQSIKLMNKCGFEKCAHFKKVGEKFGRILDVVAYQKIIDDKL